MSQAKGLCHYFLQTTKYFNTFTFKKPSHDPSKSRCGPLAGPDPQVETQDGEEPAGLKLTWWGARLSSPTPL